MGKKGTKLYEGKICGKHVEISVDWYAYELVVDRWHRQWFSTLEYLFQALTEILEREKVKKKEYKELAELFREVKAIREEIRAELEKIREALDGGKCDGR